MPIIHRESPWLRNGADIYYNNGNVGIGTTGPNNKLEVNVSTNGQTALKVINPNAGTGAYTTIAVAQDDANAAARIQYINSGYTTSGLVIANSALFSAGISATGGLIINEQANGPMILATNNLERVRIDSSGNVGIGTTSPDRLLHAEASTALTNTVQQIVRLSHITSGTPANGIGAGLEFEVETSNGNNEVGATIEAITTDVTATSEDFDLSFKLMAAGAAAAEKFKIASDGGIFAPALLQQTAVGLAVEYDTVSGEIYAETSALRFKQHVQPLELDTAGIFGLTPKRWTDRLSGREEFGLIAEEVAGLVPGLAVYGSDGPVGVKYHKLAVLMLEELKRLRQEVDQLREAA